MNSKILSGILTVSAALAINCLGQVEQVYFDTGLSPDGGFPSIWGNQFGNFTPAHDMLINQAASRYIPNSGAGGVIVSVKLSLNGNLIGQGTGNGFVNGQATPAIFTQPVLLTAGITYSLEVDTSGYLDLFHSSQISTPDGTISGISAIDANRHNWVAFPSLVLDGPPMVPEPSAVHLLFLAGLGFVVDRARLKKLISTVPSGRNI